MLFKQKIQVLNRVTLPGAIMESLDLHHGDMVYITSDGERIYISPEKEKMPRLMAVFNRDTLEITKPNLKPITKPSFTSITSDKISIQEE